MIWATISALFSPEFLKAFNEIWAQYQKSKREKTAIAIDKAFETAREQKNTETLANEIGKLIK